MASRDCVARDSVSRSVQVVRVLLVLSVLAGCAQKPAGGLSGLVYGEPPGSNPDIPEPQAEVPLSVRLACGEPCSAATSPPYCAAGILITCVDGLTVCEQCSATGRACETTSIGADCRRECEGEPIENSDQVRICCPNTRWCEGAYQTFCNDTGLQVDRTQCAEGLDCIDGTCVPAQPLVHVIFDTSESMNWTPFSDAKPVEVFSYPACDDPGSPRSRLGIAKVAFATLFSDPSYDNVLFALQRFPQRLNPYVGVFCPSAQYQASNLMTGHAGIQTSGGDWFKAHYREVLLEPFPADMRPNRLSLQRWLDFDETKVSTEVPCTADADCGAGFCVSSRCERFDNPEVRAPAAATPLGYSLFYAGEYFREHVVREGMPCVLDADCDSPHHYCVDGACRDRNRFCRQRSIVLFTDGVDTVAVGDFYQPEVQAKRLRAGLDCESEKDCGRGFACRDATCQPESNNPCSHLNMSCASYTTSQVELGASGSRLLDRLGQPIELTVHVIDAGGFIPASAPIAGYGKGLLVQAPLNDSAALLDAIRPVFDWKDADFCSQP